MCDSGSQVNLARYNAIKYRSTTKPLNIELVGISDHPIRIKRQITVHLEPWFDCKQPVKVRADIMLLPKNSPSAPIYPPTNAPCLDTNNQINGPMADPSYWKAEKIPLLLGVETYAAILNGETKSIGDSLIVQQTLFGNIIMGAVNNDQSENCNQLTITKSVHTVQLAELDAKMQRFWDFEDLALCTKKNVEHDIIEDLFNTTHYQKDDGRHVVTIPIKPHIKEIGSSREIALKRFFMLEKRGQREPEYWNNYIAFMREYENLDHMVEAKEPPKPGDMVYYIPHHGIQKGSKFRVVFDGSCQTDMGISINDAQYTGPKLQKDLHEILMRFRRHKVAVSADIIKMYRQIGIAPQQWNLQRIFFREHPSLPLKEYFLTVVTYGLSSSPYVSVKAMQDGSRHYELQFPQAVRAIHDDFYMDDCTTGETDEEKAIQLAKDISHVLGKSGFPLSKWRSNSKRLVKELAGDDAASVLF